MRGRTIILVSHHVQLCAPGASYIAALDNGRVVFEGSKEAFYGSGILNTLIHSTESSGETAEMKDKLTLEKAEEAVLIEEADPQSETSSTLATQAPASVKMEKKPARKLVEDEKRLVGRIDRAIWVTYFHACGNVWYWLLFVSVLIIVSVSAVVDHGWLRYGITYCSDIIYPANPSVRYWSKAAQEQHPVVGLSGYAAVAGIKYSRDDEYRSTVFYLSVYAAINGLALVITTLQFYLLYKGSIRASHVLYERLLEAVLFTDIRFHDTVSRGRLLNRFGNDFEGWLIILSVFSRSIYFSI